MAYPCTVTALVIVFSKAVAACEQNASECNRKGAFFVILFCFTRLLTNIVQFITFNLHSYCTLLLYITKRKARPQNYCQLIMFNSGCKLVVLKLMLNFLKITSKLQDFKITKSLKFSLFGNRFFCMLVVLTTEYWHCSLCLVKQYRKFLLIEK